MHASSNLRECKLHRRLLNSPITHNCLNRKRVIKSLLLRNLHITDVWDLEGSGCLFAVEFNKDGDKVAVAPADKLLILHGHTGETLTSFEDHREFISGVEWYSGGLITASLDKTICLYGGGDDVKGWKVNHVLKDHNEWIRSLKVSCDGSVLLAGSIKPDLYGWDLEVPTLLFSIKNAHEDPGDAMNSVNSIDFRPLSPEFITGARNGIVKVWDLRVVGNGRSSEVIKMRAHSAKINALHFLQNGMQFITNGRDSTLKLYDWRKMFTDTDTPAQCIKVYKGHECRDYNIASRLFNDDKHVVVGSEKGNVCVYDVNTGEIVEQLMHEKHPIVHMVTVSPNDMTILTNTLDSLDLIKWECGITNKTGENGVKHFKEREAESPLLFEHRAIIKDMVAKYGDNMLKIFHKYQFTLSINVTEEVDCPQVIDAQDVDLVTLVMNMNSDFNIASEILYRYGADGPTDEQIRQCFGPHVVTIEGETPEQTLVRLLRVRQKLRLTMYEQKIQEKTDKS